MRLRTLLTGVVLTGVLASAPALASAQTAPLDLSLITFNVIGLDSNDVTVGPNTYPVGVRACASSETGSLDFRFVWESDNPYLNLEGAEVVAAPSIAAGDCRDVYWNVVVTRDAAAYETARGFHVEAVRDGTVIASTPRPRELFVEKLLSQERNSVNSITGPSEVTVGEIVTFVVDANTATNGYEQLEAFLTLPSSIFELLSVSVRYTAPPGATNDAMYGDACGWDDDPTSPTYRTCVGPAGFEGGKVGGDLLTEYRVRVVGTGTADLTSAIYDMSGSSYHYNADFGREPNVLTVIASAALAPAPTSPTSPPPLASPTAPVTSPSAPPAPVVEAAGALPATGRGALPLSVLGALLLAAGLVLVAVAPPVLATATAELDGLRAALIRHEDEVETRAAWDLVAALARVHEALGTGARQPRR